ncbi:MAG: Mu-like prophage major head subunit gpT family protein [Pseudomonadota bacterium]
MDITHANLADLNTNYTAVFNERLTGTETTYGRIAMTVNSTGSQNTYPRLQEMPGMRKWVGERFVNRLEADGFTIQNEKYENTVAVPVDTIADDQYGIYAPLMGDMGQTAAELPDEMVWPQLAAGFDTLGHDGQYFFDTDHPVEDENGEEQSVSNFGGGAGTPWFLIDTTRVIKPIIFQDRMAAQITPKTSLTDDNVFERDEFVWGAKRRCATGFGAWQLAYGSRQTLDEANLGAAISAMREMRGRRGRKLNLRPTLLVVPPSLEITGRKLLLAEMNAAGASNVVRGMVSELHVENRL